MIVMLDGLKIVALLLLVVLTAYLIMFKLDDIIDQFLKILKNTDTTKNRFINFILFKNIIILILSLLILSMILFGFYYYNK